ncbi:MAG: hypothetical protein A3K83_02380 [Omnitrophica WOR_2 bacterium RBG_13_44_8b]|nr:MAG: hypothetical protein A3K83_02380 [Omnitrophica WOR_2 bacterium RBG_13_44_8b]
MESPGKINRGLIFFRKGKMDRHPDQEKEQRVVTFLNRREMDFLDKLGKDALFSTGLKLSRAKLIAWLVDFTKELRINGEGIKSEEDLRYRIKRALGRP